MMHISPGAWLRQLSPARRFQLGSLLILLFGMISIGAWVTMRIADGVVHRTATTTALYVDSLVASRVQELADPGGLSTKSVEQLDWLLRETPLGKEIAVFQVWDSTGKIVYSTAPQLVGKTFPVESHLEEALSGVVSADIGDVEGEDDLPAGAPGKDLIEIYSPIRDVSTGTVIGAAEFYYPTTDLNAALDQARLLSWLVVGGVTVLTYLLLITFVQRISNTVTSQQTALAEQVDRLTVLLRQNEELRDRIRTAAAAAVTLNEQFLNRFSAELHDGPAQEISLALLRLDNIAAQASDATLSNGRAADITAELDLVQASLRRSMSEIRTLSRGLLLPHLEPLTVEQTIDHVIRYHRRNTGASPRVIVRDVPEHASLATKIALYRLIQESLNNTWRHASNAPVSVMVEGRDDTIAVTVVDDGPGFDPAAAATRDRLGLVGMRERVVSLGGAFTVESAPDAGVRVTATLPGKPAEDNDA